MSTFKAFPSSSTKDFTKPETPKKEVTANRTADPEKAMQEALGRMVLLQRMNEDDVSNPQKVEEKAEAIMPQLDARDKEAVRAYMQKLLEEGE